MGVDAFDELKSLMTQHGNDVTTHLGRGDKLVFDDVQMAHLTADDFIFFDV